MTQGTYSVPVRPSFEGTWRPGTQVPNADSPFAKRWSGITTICKTLARDKAQYSTRLERRENGDVWFVVKATGGKPKIQRTAMPTATKVEAIAHDKCTKQLAAAVRDAASWPARIRETMRGNWAPESHRCADWRDDYQLRQATRDYMPDAVKREEYIENYGEGMRFVVESQPHARLTGMQTRRRKFGRTIAYLMAREKIRPVTPRALPHPTSGRGGLRGFGGPAFYKEMDGLFGFRVPRLAEATGCDRHKEWWDLVSRIASARLPKQEEEESERTRTAKEATESTVFHMCRSWHNAQIEVEYWREMCRLTDDELTECAT